MIYRERPSSPGDEAIDIVHRGLAREIAWLRANGHQIETWQERRRRRNLIAMHVYAYRAVDLVRPKSFVKITSVA